MKTKLKSLKSSFLVILVNNLAIKVFVSFDAVLEINGSYLPASFVVVKGKTGSGPLLDCDTAIEVGVLKIVNEVTETDNETCVDNEVKDIMHGGVCPIKTSREHKFETCGTEE